RAEIAVLATILADDVRPFLAMIGIHVADGHELNSGLFHGPFHDSSALPADADRSHDDLVVSAALRGLARIRLTLILSREHLAGVPEWQPRSDCQGNSRPVNESTSRQVPTLNFHNWFSRLIKDHKCICSGT